jgi:predicted CoA-binding protein
MATTQQIDAFLALKRLAIVGVSRDPSHFSNAIWRELRDRRYDVVPVNPNASEIDGRPCFASVVDVRPPVDGVVIMTPATATDAVVRDCIEAGVQHVWMHKGAGGGAGAVSRTAVAAAEAAGIDVIDGYCPFMFLEGTPFFHGLHGVFKKLTGSYPRPGVVA